MDTKAAYKELNLTPGVDDVQLKAAWRRLVSKWHPDRNTSPEAAVRTQRINKAYEHICQSRNGLGDASDDEAFDTPAPSPAAREAPREDARPQPDKQVFLRTVRLSVEEAALGGVKSLRGQFVHECRACAGKGQRILAQACTGCHGSGAVKRAALFGWIWSDEACEACGGDGRQREQCKKCAGEGHCQVKYQRSVRFPAGVREGTVLTVPSSHHDGFELGLEIRVEYEPHPFFVVDDGVLRCDMPVDGYAWMANRWVDVPTPGGLQQMRLNRDALSYRLRGQGFPTTPNGPRGDYLVKVAPDFGGVESPAQQALLDQLIQAAQQAADADPNSELGAWQRRLKRWNTTGKSKADKS
jgi:molecular chaperone DnaJ